MQTHPSTKPNTKQSKVYIVKNVILVVVSLKVKMNYGHDFLIYKTMFSKYI